MLKSSPVILLVAAGCFIFLCSALPTREEMILDVETDNKKPFYPWKPSKQAIKFVYRKDDFRQMEMEEGRIPAWIGRDGLMRVPSAFASTSFDLEGINRHHYPYSLWKRISHYYGVVLPGITSSRRWDEAEEDPVIRLREFVPSLRHEKMAVKRSRRESCSKTDCIASTLTPSITNPDGSDIFLDDLFDPDYDKDVNVTNVPVPTGCSFKDYPRDPTLICNNFSMKAVPDDLPRQIPLSIFEMKNTSVEVLRKDDFDLLDVLEMKLDGNLIRTMEPGAFNNISNILVLSLKNNLISSLDWQVFEGLDTLVVLSLRANQIILTDQFQVPSNETPSSSFLSKLSYLDLSENPLGDLNEFVFSHLENSPITELNLKSCSLQFIHESKFAFHIFIHFFSFLVLQDKVFNCVVKCLSADSDDCGSSTTSVIA